MARDNLTFDDLLFIARRVGVEVVAAPSSHRGQLGRMGTVVGLTRHHTGTPEGFKPTEDYPTYQVVKEGRAGLVNSLSAFGLGRHRAIYVFSEFISWHAGLWNWQGITDGNGHFLGIEAEGTGQWTDWQLDIYPRLCASILLFIGEGVDMMPRHLDGAMPRGRKSDAANLPADFAAKVANYLASPHLIPVTATTSQEDDLMAAIKVAVVFASPPDSDAVYECSMLTGTRVLVPNSQTLADRKHWLTKCGIPWMDAGGKNNPEVGRIDAFGIDIVKEAADELERRAPKAS